MGTDLLSYILTREVIHYSLKTWVAQLVDVLCRSSYKAIHSLFKQSEKQRDKNNIVMSTKCKIYNDEFHKAKGAAVTMMDFVWFSSVYSVHVYF